MLRMAGQARIEDALHRRLRFQPLGNLQSIVAVFVHTQRQGFQTFDDQSCLKCTHRSAAATHELIHLFAVFFGFADNAAA
mgnify:CR=1 FL=1